MGSDFHRPKSSELETRGAAHRIQGRPETRSQVAPGMRVPGSDRWRVTHEHRRERPSSGLFIPVQRPKVTFQMKDSLWLHVHWLSERESHRKSHGCMWEGAVILPKEALCHIWLVLECAVPNASVFMCSSQNQHLGASIYL